MSVFGSQRSLHTLGKRSGSRSDIAATNYQMSRSEVLHRGNGYGQEYKEDYFTYPQSAMGAGQGPPPTVIIHQTASALKSQCQEFLCKAEFLLQTGTDGARTAAEAEHCMVSARDIIEQLKSLAMDLRNMGQPSDSIIMSIDQCTEHLRAVHMALGGSLQRKSRGSRGSSSWDEAGKNFQEAMAWISQHKRLIETASWGDDANTLEQQIKNHNKFHSSIQRSAEVERAREELRDRRDKASLNLLNQEWESLQNMSGERGSQLHALQNVITEITRELMWVNDREEEELMFDWGNKNIDVYIPKKQESYSRLMSELEEKEKQLTKLKVKVDNLLMNNHPASDKIEAYMETLQTQWTWLLQITKCIHVHLKENIAYSQFFTEANETHRKLQQQHEHIRKTFSCDKTTPLQNLQEMLQGLEREQKCLMEQKQQVHQLLNKSKSIVRLRPRNPEEKSSSPVKVQALCDFRQDQKVICKDDMGILKDNSERSKWQVTGPGGLDMQVPSVCLLVPPPNPLSIGIASKNEQYFEAIQSVLNQLFINIKSLISWQYCLHDIGCINSLTIAMLTQMRPEEYRSIIRSLETHYQEFQRNCLGSEMFGKEDKKAIETQYTGAQEHYEQLTMQLPAYAGPQMVVQEVVMDSTAKSNVSFSRNLFGGLHALQLKLDSVESALSNHQYIPLGQGAPAQCTSQMTSTQAVQKDLDSLRGEFQKLEDQALIELEGMKDMDKAQFFSSQLKLINQRLERQEAHCATHLLRLKSLKSLLQSLLQAEDVVKVYEARLTERVTSSLDPSEVQLYQSALRTMLSELDQKVGVLGTLEAESIKAHQYNEQIDQNGHKCDIDLGLYNENVSQISDRWKRIQKQINSRIGDLDTYLQQLRQYLYSSSSLSDWINDTKGRIDAQLTTKTDDVNILTRLLNQQKALNSDITAKRETVEAVEKDGDTCANTIKDFEFELASYSAGLETLLNIPIKRTMLQSPSTLVIKEVSSLHSRYLELLTHSSDYCKYLGDSLKNLEDLKMRKTKIDLLEEEVKLLKTNIGDRDAKNALLQETLSQYHLKLNESQEHLYSLEEVKRSQTQKCNAAQANLSSSQNRLHELTEELHRLKLSVEEEKRNKKIVEERYTSQQEEHEDAMRIRHKELEKANWAKLELEKTVSDRTREIERLRKLLEEEAQNVREAKLELAKVRQQHSTEMIEVKQTFESQILVAQTNTQKLSKVRENESVSMRKEREKFEGECKELREELRKLRLTLSEEQAQRRHVEAMLQNQSAADIEEARKKSELEAEIDQLRRQKSAEESRWNEVHISSTRTLEKKSNEISCLRQSLEDETHKRRALEAEKSLLGKELAELRVKLTNSSQELIQLRSSQQELSILRVEVETQSTEKNRVEQNLTHLQARVQELQGELKKMDGEMMQQAKVAQEEAAKRRRTEVQLEKSSQAMREYISTIATLQNCQEESSIESKKTEQERKRLQETLDRNLKEHCTSAQHLATLEAEIKSLRLQLVQEQSRVSEFTKRYEALQRNMDAKTQSLKATVAETERLKELTDTLTKERLRLEEELRVERLNHDELLQGRQQQDEEMSTHITTLQQQLQHSQHSRSEHDSLVQRLSQEREKLHLEIQTIQKQASETSGLIQISQSQCTELQQERDALIRKIKIMEQDMIRLQRLEREHTELRNLKDSLQQELRGLRQKADAVNRYAQTDDTCLSIDPSTLVFDGVRKKVTARQLYDCGVIEKSTLDHLVRGQKSVQDVAVDIKLNLKGTGAIAGLAAGPTGKMTITEAKRSNLIPTDSAVKLLEAQAATGHIIDPRANMKMTVEEAFLSGLVDEEDKEQLLTAEAACIGFRDPNTTKLLSACQAMRKGMIDQDTVLRLLQAQEAAGGILDPVLSVYLPKSIAMDRKLIDEDISQVLNAKPNCYIDPETQMSANYVSLKRQCKVDPNTGLLLLPATNVTLTVQGLREKVSVFQLVDAKLLEASDLDQLREGKLTREDIEHRLRSYLRGSTCISGVYDEANKRILPIYQAMKEELLRPGTTLELLEAQAASGFVIDPVNNQFYTVEEACKKGLVGAEFKDKLLSAEKAVTGYKDPGSGKIISLFQAIEKGLIEKGHGIRLLEAQIASGGIIDPIQSHRIDVDMAFRRGYFDEELNQILKDEGDETKGFFDPNTQDNLTYLQLKSRCITDDKTGLILLPIYDKSKLSTQKNTTRKTRVVIVDPDTNREMTVHEAYEKQLIDYETYLELSQQECEWEERTITESDGTSKLVITDRKTGLQYDLNELLDTGLIKQDHFNKYRSGDITLTQFVDIISSKTIHMNNSSKFSLSSPQTVKSETITAVGSAPLQQTPSTPNTFKRISSMSITLKSPGELKDEQSPVGAIFDLEKSEKISIYEAVKRGLLDSITAQRLLEAQACTGGIVNPQNGRRISLQEANRIGVLDEDMSNRLKPAQKAYIGFEDVKTKKMMSAAEAVKEKWLPFEAGQRFLEFQFLTGGLFDPQHGQRRTLDEAVNLGWLDRRAGQKLLDSRHHSKMLTCPKTKLKISYKEAMDACILENKTGIYMLPAGSTASSGTSSPYNSTPASQNGSRRGSADQTFSTSSTSRYSSFSYKSSFSSRSQS